jgi:LysM repeat protein
MEHKMNSKYYVDPTDETEAEDFRDDENYSSMKTKKSSSQKSIIYAIGGVVILVAIMLFIWFSDKPINGVSAKRMQMLEDKISELEKTLSKMADMEIVMSELVARNQKLELTRERFDRFETSTSLRLDLISKELSNLAAARATVKKSPQKKQTPVKKTPEQPAIQYHTVTKGETLYSISRKYDLTVDTLRRINKLDAQSTIRPGQRLKVNPPTQ